MFKELGIEENIIRAITELGFESPMPVQEQVVPLLLEDNSKDVIALAQTGTGKTAAFGDLLVLATSGIVSMEAIHMAGKNNFSGKLVIDTTNPIAVTTPENGVLGFFTGPNESLMEKYQQEIPDAKWVKAFNSVGNALMYKPAFDEMRPTMFICGNDAGAKLTVTHILDTFGWDTADMGAVTAARAIEPLCMLWCIPGFLHNEWHHAFKLLK